MYWATIFHLWSDKVLAELWTSTHWLKLCGFAWHNTHTLGNICCWIQFTNNYDETFGNRQILLTHKWYTLSYIGLLCVEQYTVLISFKLNNHMIHHEGLATVSFFYTTELAQVNCELCLSVF